MKEIKKLQSWIISYEKANDLEPSLLEIKNKIKQIIKDYKEETNSKQIFFRDSTWCDYSALRCDLLKDKNFVKEYAGVDLQSYIDEALAWSEKGNKSTDLGWKLTLKNWIRKSKLEGRLIMKPKVEISKSNFINP